MDVREKLVELLNNSFAEQYEKRGLLTAPHTADDLIAHGVTVQEWISVKDRLPDEDGKYLVFEQSGGRTNTSILRFAKDARKVDRYDFKGRWKNAWYEYDSEWGHYTVDSVTHWMPPPQPPKGE
jgi:hypothetical protein